METAHEEKFFILFCSESNGCIHFDILCHADNHVVRTLGSMPPECMSYWPLQLPKQDDFVQPSMSTQTASAVHNTEFTQHSMTRSTTLVPPKTIHVHEIIPGFSGLPTDWNVVLSRIFENANRKSLSQVVPSTLVISFLNGITKFFRTTTDTKLTTTEEAEFINYMKFVAAGCYTYLETIVVQERVSKNPRFTATDVTQSEREQLFTTRCRGLQYINPMMRLFSRFVSTILSDLVKLRPDAAYSETEFYSHMGVDALSFSELKIIPDWFIHPEGKEFSKLPGYQTKKFRQVSESILSTCKKCRNQVSHVNSSNYSIINDAPIDIKPFHVLFVLCFIAVASNDNPNTAYEDKYRVAIWY